MASEVFFYFLVLNMKQHLALQKCNYSSCLNESRVVGS